MLPLQPLHATNASSSMSSDRLYSAENRACRAPYKENSAENKALKSWPVYRGVVTLYIEPEHGLVARGLKEGRVFFVSRHWITGIPKEARNDSKKLKLFLSNTWIKLIPLEKALFKISIHQRLRGGALPGLITAFSSVMGCLSSFNYVRAASKAGKGAVATLEVAGRESRATIHTAEMATSRTLDKVQETISKTQEEIAKVLEDARKEMENVLHATEETAKSIEAQIEKVLNHATLNIDHIMEKASEEAREVIGYGGEEIRKTSGALSDEVSKNIKLTSDKTCEVLRHGRKEMLILMQGASKKAKDLITHGRKEWTSALEDTAREVNQTLSHAREEVSCLIQQLGDATNEVIFSFGKEGRLLIKAVGDEVRLVADEAFTKAFAGQQMTLDVAGDKAVFVVQKTGEQIRCIMKELPCLTGSIAESAGRNFAIGLYDGLIGLSDVDKKCNEIRNIFTQSHSVDTALIVKRISAQSFSAKEKQKLYRTLVECIDSMDPSANKCEKIKEGYKEEERVKEDENWRNILTILTYIGVAMLQDEGLKESNWITTNKHLSRPIIEKMPAPVKNLLLAKGEDAFEELFPIAYQPIPEIEKINPLKIALEEKELDFLKLQGEFDNFKSEQSLREMELAQVIQDLGEQLKKEKEQASMRERQVEELKSEVKNLNEKIEAFQILLSVNRK